MRRLILNLVAGLGLAAIADAVHYLSRRASYRGSRKPLAGPRPGSWLPGWYFTTSNPLERTGSATSSCRNRSG